MCSCNCSRHEDPTDGASLWLLSARLCLWHSGGECLLPPTKHVQCVFATEATIKLRLMKQACGCSGTRAESACRPRAGTCNVFLQRSRHEAPTVEASLQLLDGAIPKADSRCVLVSASGTRAGSSRCVRSMAAVASRATSAARSSLPLTSRCARCMLARHSLVRATVDRRPTFRVTARPRSPVFRGWSAVSPWMSRLSALDCPDVGDLEVLQLLH